MYKILLVDDDKEVLQINQRYFQKNGCNTEICSEPVKVLELVRIFMPDCILLDVMMPEINGFQLCRQLRKITNVPILFLSGKISEEDKIKGFKAGADDYVEKPYSLKELYIRVVANISRHQALVQTTSASSQCIEIEPLSIHLEEHKVFCGMEEIILSKREFEVLLLLARQAGSLVTFEDIGNALWGTYSDSDRQAVMVLVSRLRKKMSDYAGVENFIQTVWSKGYMIPK